MEVGQEVPPEKTLGAAAHLCVVRGHAPQAGSCPGAQDGHEGRRARAVRVILAGMTTWDAFDKRLIAKRRGIVEGFLEFLRHNTVSQNPEGVRAGGEWLAALMRRRELEARVLETGGGPAVFGERRAPGATRTVLIYCHYDTKPAPAKAWFQP